MPAILAVVLETAYLVLLVAAVVAVGILAAYAVYRAFAGQR